MSLLRILRRTARVSPREFRVRIQQILFSRINELFTLRGGAIFPRDAHLRSLGVSAQELPSWIRERPSCWFRDEDCKRVIRDHFKAHPEAVFELLDRAKRISRDEMFILGHGPIPFQGDDKWRRDHILGIVSPRQFYSRIHYLDCLESGDSKHVWEPNRFAWAYWLGAAYVITGESSWAEKFSELTMDWFDKNPYPMGINYCSALEMALRAYAWVWALELFHGCRTLGGDVVARLIQGIWISCRHIENNLSYYFAPNTHLLGEAFALFACGAVFPQFKESSRWRHLGAEILAQEAGKQFHTDGMHRELSTCYHLYAADFYLHAVLIARQTGVALPPAVAEAAHKAAARLGELATADWTLPRLNDCDDGRLDWFSVDPLDARPSLLVARSLWPDMEFPNDPGDANGYHVWMGAAMPKLPVERVASATCTERALAASVDAPATQERPDSGVVVYRSSTRDYLLFRSGPFGYMDCGHSHDGPTSLILHLAGRPVIVDSGTGAYTQSREIRNRFRGAFGKNVLTLGGRDPSAPDRWFDWRRKTHATLQYARRTAGGLECAGFHDGFRRALGFAARVGRRVAFNDGVALIIDRWDALQPVAARLAWTLHPDLDVDWDRCGDPTESIYWRGTMRDSSTNKFHFLSCRLAADARVTTGVSISCLSKDEDRSGSTSRKSELPNLGECQLSVVSGPYSPAYGVFQNTRYLVMDFGKSNAGCVLTAFSTQGELRLSTGNAGQIVVEAHHGIVAIAEDRAEQLVS